MTNTPIRSFAKANRKLAEAFIVYLEARAFAAPTIRSYKDSLNRFVEHFGSRSILATDRQEVRVFLGTLVNKGLSGNSMHLHIAALKSFYKFIGLAGFGSNNPTLLISRKRPERKVPRVLTVNEVEKLVNAARGPFERAVLEVLYSTGVRVAELVKLRIENIDFVDHIMLVKKGKGGKDRYVLFGRPAALAIQKYLEARPSKSGFLFESSQHQDRPVHPSYVRQLVSKVSERAGVGHVYPHALRRAFACHMLSSGGNIRAIQELLGHSQVTTTQIYTTLTATELKKVHQRCHPHEQGGSDEK